MDETTELHLAAPLWRAIKARLDAVKRPIYWEIRNYAPPIAGCDQQFNHLLAQRDGIAAELRRLDAARRESVTLRDNVKAIEGFVSSSTYMDEDTARRIRDELSKVFSDLNVV